MKKYEVPECNYNISATDLVDVLMDISSVVESTNFISKKVLEKLFTSLRKYEDYSVLNPPEKNYEPSTKSDRCATKGVRSKKSRTKVKVHQTSPPFEEKIVDALFWIPDQNPLKNNDDTGKYKYLKIKLAPSNIKAAGIGAYAVNSIPKGAKGVYKGIPLSEKNANMYYSWTVKSFDPDTGEPDEEDKPNYFIDATNLETSNWTRYVNCGIKKKCNNFDSDQLYDKFFYVSTRNIKKGEELFLDYGPDYRRDNLGMKGKY